MCPKKKRKLPKETDKDFYSAWELSEKTKSKMERSHTSKAETIGVPTGIAQLDNMTGGFQRGNLTIIAGLPQTGKTAFALNTAIHAAVDKKFPTAIFSFENNRNTVFERMACNISSVPIKDAQNGTFNRSQWNDLTTALSKIAYAPLSIGDRNGINIDEISSLLKTLKTNLNRKNEKLALAIIDSAEFIHLNQKSTRRHHEFREIFKKLKTISKALNIAVVLLVSISPRDSSHDEEYKPYVSDLRKAGYSDEFADLIIFIHKEKRHGSLQNDSECLVKLIVAKQECGPVGEIPLEFISGTGSFC